MHLVTRIGVAAVALGALLGAGRTALPAPGALAPPATAASDAAEAEFAGLLLLPGATVDIRYPADALNRAAQLQGRLETLVAVWSPLLRTRSRLTWRAAVVEPEPWRRARFGGSWGAPLRVGGGTFVAPAFGDDGTVAFATRLLGGPPPAPFEEPLRGTRAEAGSLELSDLLLEIDAARAVAEVAPLSGDEPWVTGVLVQLLARYGWERADASRVLDLVALFDRLALAQGGPRARRLGDYRGGLTLEEDLWFQAQFVRGADVIWVEEGRFGAGRRLERWIGKGEPIRRADLEKKYPALLDWQRTAFAP